MVEALCLVGVVWRRPRIPPLSSSRGEGLARKGMNIAPHVDLGQGPGSILGAILFFFRMGMTHVPFQGAATAQAIHGAFWKRNFRGMIFLFRPGTTSQPFEPWRATSR